MTTLTVETTADAMSEAPLDSSQAAAASGTDDVVTPAEPARAEPEKKPSRGAGMAAGGQPLGDVPPAPDAASWPPPRNADEVYVPEEFDFSDLAEVNRELNRARARLFRVSQQLKVMQRGLADAQMAYDRQMRRELVTVSGGTAESRRAWAEIRCEHLENRVVVGKQVVEEWKKRAQDARDDLKAIENIAHNVRAQMDVH